MIGYSFLESEWKDDYGVMKELQDQKHLPLFVALWENLVWKKSLAKMAALNYKIFNLKAW